MRQSQDIYNDIGSGLLSIAPDTAVSLLMTMSINRVTDTADASARLLDLLVELRNFFVDNVQSLEKPFWRGCEVTVNVETLRINIDFKYEN